MFLIIIVKQCFLMKFSHAFFLFEKKEKWEYYEDRIKLFLMTIKKQAAVRPTPLINDLHKIIIEPGFN